MAWIVEWDKNSFPRARQTVLNSKLFFKHSMHQILKHMYVPVCIGLFSTPFAADFGPGLERASEGAQLDGAFAFYASRRRLRAWPGGGGQHSWTEIFLSTPLAAVFGTGPVAGRRGSQLDEEFCYASSRHRLQAWPGWGGGGARRWARSLLFYASRRQLRAWPGWGGGGVRSWRGVCLSIFRSLASRREAMLCSVTGSNTI